MNHLTYACSQLGASKVKDRSQALDEIDHYVTRPGAIPIKQYKEVIKALGEFIGGEARALERSPDNLAVSERVARGISILRHAVAKSANDGAGLRAKTYMAVVDIAVANYNLDHRGGTTLIPSHNDFIRIVDIIATTPSFKDQVSGADWTRTLHFLVRAVEGQLPEDYRRLLPLVLAAVNNLIGPAIYLHIYGEYRLLEPVLFGQMVRDNAVTVTTFRIINRLIPILCSVDISFTQRLISRGLHMLTGGPLSGLNSLHEQVITFLLLTQVSDYMPWGESLPQTRAGSESRSESPMGESSALQEIPEDVVSLAQLALIILNLIRSCLMPELKLLPQDSRDSKLYMILSGIVRLMTAYYGRLHKRLEDREEPSSLADLMGQGFGNGLLAASSTPSLSIGPSTKRFRRDPIEHHLTTTETVDEFCRGYFLDDPMVALQLAAIATEQGLSIAVSPRWAPYLEDALLGRWVLMAYHQFIESGTLTGSFLMEVLTRVVPLVKAKLVSTIACKVFNAGTRELSCGMGEPSAVQVRGLASQLQPIYDFPEVNGPVEILEPLLHFWGYFSVMATCLGTTYPDTPSRAGHWFALRWRESPKIDVTLYPVLFGFVDNMVDGKSNPLVTETITTSRLEQSPPGLEGFEAFMAKLHVFKKREMPPIPDIPSKIASDSAFNAVAATRWPGLANNYLLAMLMLRVSRSTPSNSIRQLATTSAHDLLRQLRANATDAYADDIELLYTAVSSIAPGEAVKELPKFAFESFDERMEIPTWAQAVKGNSLSCNVAYQIATRGDISFLDALTPIQATWALPVLVEAARTKASLLADVVRYVGLVFLLNNDVCRSEVVMVSASMLVRIPTLHTGVAKDVDDVAAWLKEMSNGGLLVTETCYRYILEWISGVDVPNFSKMLARAPLVVKVAVSKTVIETAHKATAALQRQIFEAMAAVPGPTLAEDEAAAMYCIALVAPASLLLTHLLVFCICELSMLPHLAEYGARALAMIDYKLDTEVLAWWWRSHHDFENFPAALFGLGDYGDLVHQHSLQIVSVVVALPNEGVQVKMAVEDLARLSGRSSVLDLVVESIPSIIPLAYSQHGLRNQVFMVLQMLLAEKFTQETLEESLLLVVLNIISHISVSQEDQVEDVFNFGPGLFDECNDIVADPRMTIATNLGRELLDKFILRYGLQEFFSIAANVYFLVRHLGEQVLAQSTSDSRILAMRRFKLIIGLAEKVDRYLALLLIKILGKLMIYEELWGDVCIILTLEVFEKIADDQAILRFVGQLLSVEFNKPAAVINLVLRLAARCPTEVRPLINASVTKMDHQISPLDAESVQDYLSLDHILEAGLAVIEHVWKPQSYLKPRDGVANYLKELGEDAPMAKWRSQYLADHFLSGAVLELSPVQPKLPLFCTLDDVIDFFIANHDSGAVEALLGLLIHTYSATPEVFKGVVAHFATPMNKSFIKYIVPLDYTSFTSLVPAVPAIAPLEDFKVDGEWRSNLMLALLNNLDIVFGPMFAHMVPVVPQLVEKTLPLIACFFVYLKQHDGADLVAHALNKIIDSELAEVVDIVLAIRVASKSDTNAKVKGLFQQLYQGINLTKLCEVAALAAPKTAMMIAEDVMYNKPDWGLMQKIYAHLDDPDWARGLPHRPTLEYALAQIDPSLKTRFDQASENSGLFFGEVPRDPAPDYHWAWTLNQWTLPSPVKPKTEDEVFYKVLKQLRDYGQSDAMEIAMAAKLPVKSIATVRGLSVDFKDDWIDPSQLSLLQARQVAAKVSDKQRDVLKELIRLNRVLRRHHSNLDTMAQTTMIINDLAISDEEKRLARFDAAQTLWEHGNTESSVAMLQLLKGVDIVVDPKCRELNVHASVINAVLTKWMAELRQQHPSNIMDEYVLPTTTGLEPPFSPWEADIGAAFQMFANFCEHHSKSVTLDNEIATLERRLAQRQREAETIKANYRTLDEKKFMHRHYLKVKQQLVAVQKQLDQANANRHLFQAQAVEFYLKKLIVAPLDEDTDRFFACWLDCADDDDLNRRLAPGILALPSYQLVLWTNQLVSRIDTSLLEFQKVLSRLLESIVKDHPFHSLYQLISLTLHKDFETLAQMASKYEAAEVLWQRLLQLNVPFLRDIHRMCLELVALSETKVDKKREMQLGAYWRHLPPVPPPTQTIAVRPDCDYSNVVHIVLINPKVSIAMLGLSRPKILVFKLSDGLGHKMLLKSGNDDLRQDLIMEQVFVKVNHMLARDKEALRRHLRIKTYNAVPMGPQLGMIEFVPHSVGLIDVIKQYHSKQDKMSLEEARETMKRVQNFSREERVAAYREVTKKVKPVLRQYFVDTFPSTDSWYALRLTYTRGVATSLMIGYILGLGDRHCNNVMLDSTTGEPIHIDLGVAFDQGKRLPIPETVPFRLTRDIVDGFGVTGVHGMFTVGCLHTMRVLRGNSSHILAILDVLRWDPLYSWSISAMKLDKIQKEADTKVDLDDDGSEAAKAIVTVSDKLRGIPGGLSVEATVSGLIQEATSEENLALIYFGWCPFF